MEKYELITVLGPTACGKTSFAAALARRLDTEIISADSRQVYRRMNIGTGKDLDDYTVNGVKIPCHLIDICEPGTRYDVFKYHHDFFNVFYRLRSEGKIPVLCGGTGMYIEAVLKGYRLPDAPPDPELRNRLNGKTLRELEDMLASYKVLHNKSDIDSARRAIRAIEIEEYRKKASPATNGFKAVNSLIIGLRIGRELRREKISQRLHSRMAEGMADEVRALIDSGIHPDNLTYYGLEYKYLTLYVTGKMTREEMMRQLEIAIHQFAKRQMTWFRGMERRGFLIHWIDASLPAEEKIRKTIEIIKQNKL
ncbi:MAG: tRNA (adenosine(37)-N6)-dimethylallyltransferase MiaA [Tannerella sp.]|jgi:tRNA dimethylallyltransferase|nr:tRNA (adenosine(37)-N6)-dimethylallyltransferase MiaA [Tannerella sp.]